jgi:hypothetical protein
MQMKRLLAVMSLVLCAPLSAEEPAPPFQVGPWELGMSREQVSSFQDFGPYKDVRVTGGIETWDAEFLGRKTNVAFVFDTAGVRYIQVNRYEGSDPDAAIAAAMEIYDLFAGKFGGATVENVSAGGQPSLDRGAVEAALHKILGKAKEVEQSTREKHKATLLMRFDMKPILQPKGSRLHCQWVYAGKLDTFYILLFQDRPDAPSRTVKANIEVGDL